MRRFSRKWLVLAPVVIGLPPILSIEFAPHVASAQTAATATATTTATPCTSSVGGAPIVSVSLQQVPERFSATGADLGTSTRNPALNPNGISYADCINDLTLQFRLTACNFNTNPGTSLQVWASKSSDCTAATDRGGQGGISQCWLVSQGSTDLTLGQGGVNYNVRVRDIVGPQQISPSPITLTSNGPEACNAQPTFLAVPINVNFVPVDSSGNGVGQAYQYQLSTDMVGPMAPVGPTIADGDTLFVVNWTPNTDTDTQGYDVAIDPIPGQEPLDATMVATSAPAGQATVQLVCPDGGATATSSSGGSSSGGSSSGAGTDDGSLDGSLDATIADAEADANAGDSGCHLETIAGSSSGNTSNNGGTCNDPVLSSGVINSNDGTDAAIVSTEELDDAGNVIDSGTQNITGGGIWNPPPGAIINPNATVGTTVTGVTSSTYTIKGLKNGFTYNVVVAAVDGFGNIGPPSTEVCDFPAPVNDFWTDYRNAGGGAGGGFCALEAVGAPVGPTVAFAGVGALFAAALRRRRGKKQ